MPVAIRIYSHCTPCVVSGGILSASSGRKYPKNAAKAKVLESFPRLECRPYENSSAARTGRSVVTPCFRMAFASPAAGRSRGPALTRRGRGTLSPAVGRVTFPAIGPMTASARTPHSRYEKNAFASLRDKGEKQTSAVPLLLPPPSGHSAPPSVGEG